MWEILCTWEGGRQSFPRLQRPLSSFDGSHVAHTVKSRNTHIHINICVWHWICLWAWINYVAFHKAGCCLFSHPADNRYHSFLLARSMQYFLISSNSGGKYLALQLLTAAKCSPASRKLFWCWAGSAQSSVSHTYTSHGFKHKVCFEVCLWELFHRLRLETRLSRRRNWPEGRLMHWTIVVMTPSEKGRHLTKIPGRWLEEQSVFQRLPRANFNQSDQQQEGLLALTEASQEKRENFSSTFHSLLFVQYNTLFRSDEAATLTSRGAAVGVRTSFASLACGHD